MLVTAYLGLGSNIGDRISSIRDAISRLAELDDIRIEAISSLYETEPAGYIDQPDFINCVVKIETGYNPYQLLDAVHNIENSMGRIRNIRWGPRIIDIDILLFGNTRIKTDDLEIPHPRMLERSFVMVPLLEIADRSVLEGIGVSPDCSYLADGETIRKL